MGLGNIANVLSTSIPALQETFEKILEELETISETNKKILNLLERVEKNVGGNKISSEESIKDNDKHS